MEIKLILLLIFTGIGLLNTIYLSCCAITG